MRLLFLQPLVSRLNGILLTVRCVSRNPRPIVTSLMSDLKMVLFPSDRQISKRDSSGRLRGYYIRRVELRRSTDEAVKIAAGMLIQGRLSDVFIECSSERLTSQAIGGSESRISHPPYDWQSKRIEIRACWADETRFHWLFPHGAIINTLGQKWNQFRCN
ncbi:hypothetical protein BKA67DRAFT_369743 [Truncatella angustata]|uniref:Uncharacterized protein n=1 Tax=Truncatella angustata TaxID=152316 RepID=A0A9P8UEX9_9PEZI|nr:uncharacterized protein BKA67DRAFT_369743 [Truncatella angustata]KAH6648657.1 hypothetical protein BKA67DRAFT_369743 [Truncatella angustata]